MSQLKLHLGRLLKGKELTPIDCTENSWTATAQRYAVVATRILNENKKEPENEQYARE